MARPPQLTVPHGVTADEAAAFVRDCLDQPGIKRTSVAAATGVHRSRVARILKPGRRTRWSWTLLALWNYARQSAPWGLKRTDTEAAEDRLRRVVDESVKSGEADRWADVIAALARFRG
jgi:hypothetical protein